MKATSRKSLDVAGEQLFRDAGVEGNYVKFEEFLVWLRLDGRGPINGRAGVLPLAGERGGPDGGVDPVQLKPLLRHHINVCS